MTKFILAFLIPLVSFAQNVEDLLTSSTWNISYNITPDGERIEEESEEKIRASWVKFNKDGTFEVPNSMTGKILGNWTYNPETNAIHFQEGKTKYRALVEEISELELLLNYVDNGGFKIGLIHYVYVPKTKSNEETIQLLTSGKWNVVLKRFESVEDRIPNEDIEDTWFEFNPDGTYQKSEVIGEDILSHNGTWFMDEKFQLNLDSGENTIYTVIGDKSRLILTTISGGYNTIEMRKAK